MKLFRSLFFLVGLGASNASIANAVITPDITYSVRLSNTDINRLVCKDGTINDVFYSKEKGMTVINKGENAFVKYLIREQNGIEEHVVQPTEIHVVCNAKTYTIIAHPENISAQTVFMSEGIKKSINKNIAQYAGLSHEERLFSLSLSVYRNELDESFQEIKINTEVTVTTHDPVMREKFKRMQINKNREINVEGVGLLASEYTLMATDSLYLHEKDFLHFAFGAHIKAITLTKRGLKKGDVARVIIIEEKSS